MNVNWFTGFMIWFGGLCVPGRESSRVEVKVECGRGRSLKSDDRKLNKGDTRACLKQILTAPSHH